MTDVCPGNRTMSVGQGTGAPSVSPGTVGLPSITGLPCTKTLVDTEAPGTGMTVAVVHGLDAGDGGTGQTGPVTYVIRSVVSDGGRPALGQRQPRDAVANGIRRAA